MRDFSMEARRHGKHQIMVEGIRLALSQKKSVVVATPDQAASIARLKDDFPDALFSLVGDWGLKIHRGLKRPRDTTGAR